MEKIVCPYSPVYSEEIKFIADIGIKVTTSLTDKQRITDKRIGISISNAENIGRNPEYNYSLQFKVTCTKSEVKSWGVESDNLTQIRYRIDEDGQGRMVSECRV